MTTEEFIKKAKEVHGDKYDYSKVEYSNAKTKVCIACPEHGEFWQKPYNHLNGQGCSKCRYDSLSKKYRKTKDEFIEKSLKKHGNRYDYSKVKYLNWKTKVCIICPEHGEFWQTPNAHENGNGCPKCANRLVYDTNSFIEKANEIHCDKYDYSKVSYKNNRTKVCIICPEHGEFWQTPKKHLIGHGCPVCAGNVRMENNNFIEKAKEVHGDKYDYSKVDYVNTHTKVCIICPKHGEFWQIPSDHLVGKGCPSCGNKLSKAESEIYEFLCLFIDKNDIIRRDRSLLGNLELDLYIPSLSIAIEYNGLRWHSEEFNKDKYYHLRKLERCNEKGVRLLQIFEDEWLENKNLVLEKIKHIMGFNTNKVIFARNTYIKEIENNTARDFLSRNHIQGFVASTVYFGAFYEGTLISVMSFKRETESLWNLTRFASDMALRCVGVGGKIFAHFVRTYNPDVVESFADRRWTLSDSDNLYTKIGFKLDKVLKPDYRYVNGFKREHKFNYRKAILNKKYGLPLSMTETEMTEKLGFHRIWDCGLYKFIWRNRNDLPC